VGSTKILFVGWVPGAGLDTKIENRRLYTYIIGIYTTRTVKEPTLCLKEPPNTGVAFQKCPTSLGEDRLEFWLDN
jgi:hypothetical protein